MQNIIIIVAVAVMVVLIPVWVSLSSKAKREEKAAEINRNNFLKECKANGISSEHDEGAHELLMKYSISSATANSLFAADRNNTQLNEITSEDSLSSVISAFAWMIWIFSILGWIVLSINFNNFAIGLAGFVVSIVFLLMLLGLAKIVNYLYKIYRSTLIISSRLNQTSEK